MKIKRSLFILNSINLFLIVWCLIFSLGTLFPGRRFVVYEEFPVLAYSNIVLVFILLIINNLIVLNFKVFVDQNNNVKRIYSIIFMSLNIISLLLTVTSFSYSIFNMVR